MNNQRCAKEARTKFLPGHVGRTMNAHELVSNNNPSIQEGKEAPGHTTGQQSKRPPKGPTSEQNVHTQRLKSP